MFHQQCPDFYYNRKCYHEEKEEVRTACLSCKFDPENVRPFVPNGLEFVSGMDRNDYHDNIGLNNYCVVSIFPQILMECLSDDDYWMNCADLISVRACDFNKVIINSLPSTPPAFNRGSFACLHQYLSPPHEAAFPSWAGCVIVCVPQGEARSVAFQSGRPETRDAQRGLGVKDAEVRRTFYRRPGARRKIAQQSANSLANR